MLYHSIKNKGEDIVNTFCTHPTEGSWMDQEVPDPAEEKRYLVTRVEKRPGFESHVTQSICAVLSVLDLGNLGLAHINSEVVEYKRITSGSPTTSAVYREKLTQVRTSAQLGTIY